MREHEVIHLVATSAHPNFGDEFITASWLRFLARHRPDADVVLDCPQPGLATYLFEGIHPRLRTTDLLWRLTWQTADLSADERDAHVDRVVSHLGSPHFDVGLARMRRATTIHLLGGGHIVATWPLHLWLLRASRRLADVSGARLVATGLGLHPTLDAARLRAELAGFDHSSVRDQPSAELSGATLAPDDAFLGVPDLPGWRAASPAVPGEVVVCLQSDLSTPETLDTAVAGIRRLLGRSDLADRPVRWVEAIPGTDRIAYERLSDLIPEERFTPFLHIWEHGLPVAPGQTWITSRFHFHLLASACGADGVAIEVNDDYYRVKHQSLVDLGTGWPVAQAGSAEFPTPASAPGFRRKAADLVRAKLDEARTLYPAVPKTSPATEPPAPASGRRWAPASGRR